MNNVDFTDLTETCIISEQDFIDINNLYKFKPIKDKNITYFYNKKRNCQAIRKSIDKLLKTTIYLLNKPWFKSELFATNSETLQKIGNKTPELYLMMKKFNEERESEKRRYRSLVDNIQESLDELLAISET